MNESDVQHETVGDIARDLVRDRFSIGTWIVFLALVALLAWLFGRHLHTACTNPSYDVVADTPHYDWCEKHVGAYPWAVTLIPTGAVALLSALLRRSMLP